MSETKSTLFNKRVSGLLMAGAFILLAIVVVVRFRTSGFPVRRAPEPVKIDTLPAPHSDALPPPVFEVSETFYQTIIDNNLFRPLGWTPPRVREPYRLLGTLLPRDANTSPKAIIQSTASERSYL